MSPRPERYALVLVIAAVVTLTLAPFDVSVAWTDLPERLRESLSPGGADAGWELVWHFLVFALVGVAGALALGDRLHTIPTTRLATSIALACLGFELLQLAEPARHARVTDWLCNTLALFIGGVWFGRARRLQSVRERLRSTLVASQRRWMSGIIAAASLAWLIACAYPMIRLKHMNWDSGATLCIANEADGSRPWLGEVRFLGVYAPALDTNAIRDIAAQASRPVQPGPREAAGLLLGYDFTGDPGSAVNAAGRLSSPESSLAVPSHVRWSTRGDGIAIHTPALLSAPGVSHALAAELESRGTFTLEAWIAPLDVGQDGPARILSFSTSPLSRNFTLAQDGPDLEFRVRNGIAGENGLRHAVRAWHVVGSSWMHVFAAYDHGLATIRDASGRTLSSTDLREPLPHVRMGTTHGGRIAAAILIVCLLAIPVSSLLSHHRLIVRHGLALAVALLAAALPTVSGPLIIGGPWNPAQLLWTAALGPTAHFLVSRFITSHPPREAA